MRDTSWPDSVFCGVGLGWKRVTIFPEEEGNPVVSDSSEFLISTYNWISKVILLFHVINVIEPFLYWGCGLALSVCRDGRVRCANLVVHNYIFVDSFGMGWLVHFEWWCGHGPRKLCGLRKTKKCWACLCLRSHISSRHLGGTIIQSGGSLPAGNGFIAIFLVFVFHRWFVGEGYFLVHALDKVFFPCV